MLKTKLAVFLAAATLSLSASAGFVQYDLSGATLSDGGNLQGFFVQNTDDKAIAWFELQVSGGTQDAAEFFPSPSISNVDAATTYFAGAGPTNFSVYNDQDIVMYRLALTFGATGTPGQYAVFGNNTQSGQVPFASRNVTGGFATLGQVNAGLLAYLESGQSNEVTHIVPTYIGPTQVPEPASIALLALSAAGIFGTRRKMKSAS